MPEEKPTRYQLQQQRRKSRERFARVKRMETQLGRQLSQVGRQVGILVDGFAPRGFLTREEFIRLKEALRQYAEALQPWAVSVMSRFQAEVAQRDTHAWEELARSMGRSLQLDIRSAPVGALMQRMMNESVEFITSLPLEAAERVHEWVQKGITQAVRADAVAEAIRQTGHVTAGRARLIARTEIARQASTLTEARATHIGSPGYFWRTSGDRAVRERHKKLEGQFIPWNSPPVAGEKGERYHAGQGPNCRCWPEPVVPDI